MKKDEAQWKYIITLEIRWMPEEGEEDLSWPWIKEALPPIQLTKVLPFVITWPFVVHLYDAVTVYMLTMLCRTSLSCQ